ncbi:TfoX/Sxy family protein [Xylophilus sp. GW821-FHT01B05]
MSSFVDSLHEVFEPLGRISVRRMFGCHGVWHGDPMIALVAANTLYLKADAQSAPHFDQLRLPAFEFHRDGKPVAMSYRQAPESIFDDREQALLWGQRAYEAALRSGQPPRAPKLPNR